MVELGPAEPKSDKEGMIQCLNERIFEMMPIYVVCSSVLFLFFQDPVDIDKENSSELESFQTQ